MRGPKRQAGQGGHVYAQRVRITCRHGHPLGWLRGDRVRAELHPITRDDHPRIWAHVSEPYVCWRCPVCIRQRHARPDGRVPIAVLVRLLDVLRNYGPANGGDVIATAGAVRATIAQRTPNGDPDRSQRARYKRSLAVAAPERPMPASGAAEAGDSDLLTPLWDNESS